MKIFQLILAIFALSLMASCGAETPKKNSTAQESKSDDLEKNNDKDRFDVTDESNENNNPERNDSQDSEDAPSDEDIPESPQDPEDPEDPSDPEDPEEPVDPEDPVDPEEPEVGIDLIDSLRVMNGLPGETFSSKDHPYGVFVVEAYFLTCPYCNQNAPMVKDLAAEYEGTKNVHILDVGTDCRQSDYRQWQSRHNPEHKVLNDCGGRSLLKSKLNVTLYPTTIVVDCIGNEVFRAKGLWNNSKIFQLKEAIDRSVALCSK